MAALHRPLSPDDIGKVHGHCSTVVDGLGLPATAIIRLASQDQQELWRVSLDSLPTP